MDLIFFLISFFCVAVACYFAVKYSDQVLKDAIEKQNRRVAEIPTRVIERRIMPERYRIEMEVIDAPDRPVPDNYIRHRMIERMLADLPNHIFKIDCISPYEKIGPETPHDRCREIRECQMKRVFKYRGELSAVPYEQSDLLPVNQL